MTYTPAIAPRTAQIDALVKSADHKAFAFLLGMRVGKTAVAIHDWGRRVDAGELNDLLVVAPAGAYRPWEGEFTKHMPPEMSERLATGIWVSGAGVTAKRKLESLLAVTDRPRVLLVNVEALSTVQAAEDLCREFLSRRKAMFVVDESSDIRNSAASRTKTVLRLGELAPYRRILTGLVTPRSPLDLFAQFGFLDWNIIGHRSYHTFKMRYAVVKYQCFLPWDMLYAKMKSIAGGKHVPTDYSRDEMIQHLMERKMLRRNELVEMVVAYRNEEELRAKIEPYSIRVRLEDCYDVPKDAYVIREVQLTPEQKRIYAEMKQFATAALSGESHVTASAVIVQILRLHQILCGHVTDESGVEHEIPERRTKELIDLLSDYDGKAIVWCSYDNDVRKVSERLEKEFGKGCVARFWGGNKSTREQEEVLFKSDPKCLFMVATPDAGGRGRDWSVADLVVYYSSKNNLEHRDQSEMRVKAFGKDRPITYVDLLVKDTVEGLILQALRRKLDLASLIQGDAWREWVV